MRHRRVRSWLPLALVAVAAAGCGKTSRDSDRGTAGTGGAPAGEAMPSCALDLASGEGHHCALYADGSVWCWGEGTSGQLGDGALSPSLAPVPVGLSNIRAVAAGKNHGCALEENGQLWCWGSNAEGQLGDAAAVVGSPILVRGSADRISQVALSGTQACAIDASTHVFCWGTDAAGMRSFEPMQISAVLEPVVGLYGGDGAMVAQTVDGRLLDISNWALAPRLVSAGGGNLAAANSVSHSCVVKRSGTIWCTGLSYGPDYRLILDLGEDLVEVGAGDIFTCALSRAGWVACQGWNDFGQLGDGTLQSRTESAPVTGVADAIELSVGRMSACVRTREGEVFCWGMSPDGTPVPLPERISGCSDSPLVPDPSATPAPSGADRFVEAGRAWAQLLCECGYGAGSDSLEACILEEQRRGNSGCLAALAAADDAYLDCRADALWVSARCYGAAACDGGIAQLPSCPVMYADCGPEQAHPGYDFCQSTFPCGDSADAPWGWRLWCNGVADCADGFDELNCSPAQTQFQCADRAFVPLPALCDGSQDCSDGSDETHCY